MTERVHVEYGVLLSAGVVAAAASADVACDYPHGWPACRRISSTPCGQSGRAAVDIGPWVPLRGAG